MDLRSLSHVCVLSVQLSIPVESALLVIHPVIRFDPAGIEIVITGLRIGVSDGHMRVLLRQQGPHTADLALELFILLTTRYFSRS